MDLRSASVPFFVLHNLKKLGADSQAVKTAKATHVFREKVLTCVDKWTGSKMATA